MDKLKINEIFYSIQGESSFAGAPTVFVRTTGCNLRCTYCDTQYSYYEGDWMEVQQVLDRVSKFPTQYVCLTGGEPLLQPASISLLAQLCDLNKLVSLETSGERLIADVDRRVKKILDVKTPDSGAPDSFNFENLQHLTPNDELKFVICSERDLNWAADLIDKHSLKTQMVFFSPSFGVVESRWLAEQILNKNLPVRLHLQLHKYIWSPGARGV